MKSMYLKYSTPLNRNKQTTSDRRSTSPLIWQQSIGNDIRIITNPSPKPSTRQRSATSSSATAASSRRSQHGEKVFSALFIVSEIKFHSERLEAEFSLSNSWLGEYLNINVDECTCCLCKLQQNCGTTEICVKKHPCDISCTSDRQSHRKNTMFKYQKRAVCDECMSALTVNSKKTKQKIYRCFFQPCSFQTKAMGSLRKHYLDEHLKVKNFICSVCEAQFKSKSGVKMHERKH